MSIFNIKTKKMENYKNITNFDQLVEVEHGKIGIHIIH